MHLLFSLYLPLLPLEALTTPSSEQPPYAVLDKERVLVASSEAVALGVQRGMRGAGATAVAPAVQLLDRDPLREQAALHAAVLALYRYTPDIAWQPDFGLLLDVGPSLKLFGGAPALSRLVLATLRQQGLTARLGVAPTASGAWLLARETRMPSRGAPRRVLHLRTLARALDTVGCDALPAALPHTEWLTGVGARDLGAIRRLPRTGLIRRTSTQLAESLDKAYGEATELHRWLPIPETFSAQLDTNERVEHAEALLDGASRLVLQLTGWLTVRQLAVSAVTLDMVHERGRAAVPPTPLVIAVAEPTWHDEHLLRLLKERLSKVTLTAPVIGLRLDATQLAPMAPPNLTLFPEPGGIQADIVKLMELLTAQLGAERVLAPVMAEDHRPELCNQWQPAATRMPAFPDVPDLPVRPFWLLRQPIRLLLRGERPFYGSPLVLIRGPERIEGGWWDDGTAVRDYYVAQGTDASCYWIYRERSGNMDWYLHGLFA